MGKVVVWSCLGRIAGYGAGNHDLVAVPCRARLCTRAPLWVVIVEYPHSQGAPVPAQSVMPAVLSSTAARSCDRRVGAADCGRLLELLSLVPDPRCRRGVRHTVASILAIAAAAVLAGCTAFLAEVAGFASLASACGDQADPPG